jgi:hypothetical protein
VWIPHEKENKYNYIYVFGFPCGKTALFAVLVLLFQHVLCCQKKKSVADRKNNFLDKCFVSLDDLNLHSFIKESCFFVFKSRKKKRTNSHIHMKKKLRCVYLATKYKKKNGVIISVNKEVVSLYNFCFLIFYNSLVFCIFRISNDQPCWTCVKDHWKENQIIY